MEKRFYMKSEEVSDKAPAYIKKSSHASRVVFVLVFLFLLVVAVLAGLYFLGAQSFESEKQALSATPTVMTEAPTDTPTPTPDLDRAALSIAILNGSGQPGAAGEISTYLKELGYTIEGTGNATRFDYEGITIAVSEEKQAYLDLLKNDLAEKFASASASISAKLTTDAEVIVGK